MHSQSHARPACGTGQVLLSDSFYQSLSRDNVTLVASGVTGVTEKGLVDEQGREHEVDVIIWATGELREEAFGKDGTSTTSCYLPRL